MMEKEKKSRRKGTGAKSKKKWCTVWKGGRGMVPDFLCEASETLEESTDGTYFSVPDGWNIRTGNAVL